MIKMEKRLIGAIILFLITAFTVYLILNIDVDIINNDNTNKENVMTVAKGEIKVHFIDVGQADSILIQQGDNSMLVDAGNNDDGGLVCDYIKKQGIEKLDYVVGTHPHEDHIGGLDNVIDNFGIDQIYMPKKTATTKTYKDVLTSIKSKKLKITTPKVGDTFKLGDAEITIMAPFENYEDANNCSIVLKLKYKENSFLFTGDAERVSETAMVDANLDLKCDVLKVSHHGSKTSSTNEFLKLASPKYAVISVGKNNDYDHPKVEIMNRFKKFKIPVYRTDELGSIVVIGDGSNLKFDKNPGSYGGMVIK